MRRLGWLAAWVLMVSLGWAAPRLMVSGQQLAVDGQARFVLGVSLFDALGPTAPRDEDLDALRGWGVWLVRVWAHWHTPVYGADGSLRPEGRERLLRLARRLEQRGLLLELVVLRPGQLQGEPYAVFASGEARRRAAAELAAALRPHRGIIFDLYNEHDHAHGSIDHHEARALRDGVKKVDPDRLVTLSSTEYHFFDGEGMVSETGRANLREEIETVGVDLLAPHMPRTPDWAASTGPRVQRLRQALQQLGRTLPIYLNEPQRAHDAEPTLVPADYVRAATGSREAGAAGWIFHTAAGYSLSRQHMIAALRPEERQALAEFAEKLPRR